VGGSDQAKSNRKARWLGSLPIPQDSERNGKILLNWVGLSSFLSSYFIAGQNKAGP